MLSPMLSPVQSWPSPVYYVLYRCDERRPPRSTQPVVCPHPLFHSPPLLLLPRHHVPEAAPRFPPTRCDTRESSLDRRSALQTQSSRPAAIAPDRRSCTSALQLPLQTDPPGKLLPSIPGGSNIPALLPLQRYIARPSLPPAQAVSVHPGCTLACSRWGGQLSSRLKRWPLPLVTSH